MDYGDGKNVGLEINGSEDYLAVWEIDLHRLAYGNYWILLSRGNTASNYHHNFTCVEAWQLHVGHSNTRNVWFRRGQGGTKYRRSHTCVTMKLVMLNAAQGRLWFCCTPATDLLCGSSSQSRSLRWPSSSNHNGSFSPDGGTFGKPKVAVENAHDWAALTLLTLNLPARPHWPVFCSSQGCKVALKYHVKLLFICHLL